MSKRTVMRSICVFCGSKAGTNGQYGEAARQLGRGLARRAIRLVYGGGSVGLMGVVADAVLEAGGEVTGVIPQALATKELLHDGVTDMRVVDSMHTRKALMAELADAFIAMPGAYGTFEELLEMITWTSLGIHAKPIGILNVAGYFDHLVRLIDHAIAEGFLKARNRDILVVGAEPDDLLDHLTDHKLPVTRQWITAGET